MKKILWIAVLVVVIGGAYFWMKNNPKEREIYTAEKVEWTFYEKSAAVESNPPTTQVYVYPIGIKNSAGATVSPLSSDSYLLGEYQGTCSSIPDLNEEADGVLLGYAQCWWAGAGTQFRAVLQKDTVEIQKRDVQEEDEVPPPWQKLITIALEYQ